MSSNERATSTSHQPSARDLGDSVTSIKHHIVYGVVIVLIPWFLSFTNQITQIYNYVQLSSVTIIIIKRYGKNNPEPVDLIAAHGYKKTGPIVNKDDISM